MMKNIAGYKFVELSELETIKQDLIRLADSLQILGTILLSHEGINFYLAGQEQQIDQFIDILNHDTRFCNIPLKTSYSKDIPFKRMKVKIKKEIITMRQEQIDAVAHQAPNMRPSQLKAWLDQNHDFTLLDTRNDYEVRFGTFEKAKQCHINDFSEFPEACQQIDKDKPVVMFCTGGIRCEKAALYMKEQGYNEVYQLEGGILKYFEEEGGAHYQGDCFVFDERIALTPQLEPSNVGQCLSCQGPSSAHEPCACP